MKKKILITGSTDGIGKIAALKLAKEGHEVYVHGRKEDKLKRVVEYIKKESNNHAIQGFVTDFSDLNAVKNMSVEISERLSSLDVLINNAGVFKASDPITDDGLDIRMAVNYIAPYMLTQGILDVLNAGTKPRIINLSSAAQSSVNEKLLNGSISGSDQDAYAQSKLAILMWSFHLALLQPDICVIALNPGSLLNTKMVKEAYGRFWSSADKGADIIYDLATVDKYLNNSGQYFDNDAGDFGIAHPDAYDEERISSLVNSTKAILKDIVN